MATIAQPAGQTYHRPAVLEWLTTVDHKKIGIMYLYTTFTMFFVAGCFALVFRTQLATANSSLITHDTFNELVSIHGSTMIWLFAIPMWAGFGNYLVPLQIGARDMAFPRINAFSYWTLPAGIILMYSGFLMKGGAQAAGWTAYSPLANQQGAGLDFWILGVIVVGISSTVGAANFLVTITRMRAPGMTMFRMPIFVWSILVTQLLQLLATPVLAASLSMLYIDHNFGAHFFDPAGGGNALMWQNIFWFYSHPAVYIMVLPGFGMISEILPVFSRKPLFGYKSMVFALVAIGGLSFSVWAHHMFTTGGVLLPFFAFLTGLIGVPTGVKFFNWIGTMWGGSITYESPMLYSIGFLICFLIGGINGVVTASVPVDFAVHDTYLVVSHIHYVLFGGSIFAALAGLIFWFPKMFGRKLNETWLKISFWMMFIAMNVTFFPMHLLGLDGMPRRVATYAGSTGWGPINFVETLSAYFIGISLLLFLVNVIVTLMKPKDQPADPWQSNTLEWWATSPPKPYNFDDLPPINSERPVWDARQAGLTSRAAEGTTGA
ncbi:cytochrome c oxidase subunit I [bacterium]|jgi:cytochrome c oxidase subunit 1|nr:cytochrome c oxidase subunit I [bacterium]